MIFNLASTGSGCLFYLITNNVLDYNVMLKELRIYTLWTAGIAHELAQGNRINEYSIPSFPNVHCNWFAPKLELKLMDLSNSID